MRLEFVNGFKSLLFQLPTDFATRTASGVQVDVEQTRVEVRNRQGGIADTIQVAGGIDRTRTGSRTGHDLVIEKANRGVRNTVFIRRAMNVGSCGCASQATEIDFQAQGRAIQGGGCCAGSGTGVGCWFFRCTVQGGLVRW